MSALQSLNQMMIVGVIYLHEYNKIRQQKIGCNYPKMLN